MKRNKYILWGCSAAFILLNCLCIWKGIFVFPVLSLVLAMAYLLIFHIDIVMYLMAFVTPLSVIMTNEKVNLGLSLPSEAIMISLTLLFFCRILYDLKIDRKLALHPISIAIYVYLFWMFITCITSELPIVSFKFWASKIWFITSCYFMMMQLIRNNLKNAVTFFDCHIVGLCIVVIYTTLHHAMYGFSEFSGHWVMSPFYNDHTAYGAILAFFVPIIVGFLFLPDNSRKKKIFYAVGAAIILAGLYLSFSRAAWISFVASVCVWIVLKLRIKLSWLVVAGLLVGTVFFFYADDILYRMGRNSQDASGNFTEQLQSMTNISTDASNVERLNRWTAAFSMIKERPVLGWGPGTYQFEYAPFQRGKYKTIISTNFGDGGNAHSEYIGPCAETGFVGLFTVLALVFVVIYCGIVSYVRAKDKTLKTMSLCMTLALISYFVHGFLNNFLDTDKLSLPFWSAFAVIAVVMTAENDVSPDKSLKD